MRYRVHEGTSRYTTVDEFTGTAVPESAEWKEQYLHSSPPLPTHAAGDDACAGVASVYTRIDL